MFYSNLIVIFRYDPWPRTQQNMLEKKMICFFCLFTCLLTDLGHPMLNYLPYTLALKKKVPVGDYKNSYISVL